jgi:hypothetical protein
MKAAPLALNKFKADSWQFVGHAPSFLDFHFLIEWEFELNPDTVLGTGQCTQGRVGKPRDNRKP